MAEETEQLLTMTLLKCTHGLPNTSPVRTTHDAPFQKRTKHKTTHYQNSQPPENNKHSVIFYKRAKQKRTADNLIQFLGKQNKIHSHKNPCSTRPIVRTGSTRFLFEHTPRVTTTAPLGIKPETAPRAVLNRARSVRRTAAAAAFE